VEGGRSSLDTGSNQINFLVFFSRFALPLHLKHVMRRLRAYIEGVF
jgi:hypothetical protein